MGKKCLSLIIVVFLSVALFPATGLAFTTIQLEGWARLNIHRSIAGVNLVALDEEWCRRCQLHSRYMYLNNTVTHIEDPSKPGYTEEGALAGYGCVGYASNHLAAVDQLIGTVFHRIALLEPRLTKIGFGFENGFTTIWDLIEENFTPDPTHQWALYPGPRQTGVPTSFKPWRERPNPLPGVTQPVGYPITYQSFYYILDAREGQVLQESLFDSSNNKIDCYSIDAGFGRAIIPKNPLKENTVYYVSVTGKIRTADPPYIESFTKTWWFATKRSTPYHGSFWEVVGIPPADFSTTHYFPWYDCQHMKTWILLGNPQSSSVSASIYVAGKFKQKVTLPAGGRYYAYYSGLMDGPVKIVSSQPVYATQRSIYQSSFCEVVGIPKEDFSTEHYFPWYDCQYMKTWILLGNPQSSSVSASIYVAGKFKQKVTLPAGGRYYAYYSGLMDGPVKIVSSQPVYATQRSIYQTSFSEVVGIPSGDFSATHYFPWYDCQWMKTWILLANPSTSSAHADIYIAGSFREGVDLSPGSRYYAIYPGLMNGPVKVVSNKPIFCTQRSIYQNSFSEVVGIPSADFSTEHYFPWYDGKYMDTWVLVGNPQDTTATVSFYLAGSKKEQVQIAPEKSYYAIYPFQMNGPVKVVSSLPVFCTQRSVY